MSEQTVKTFDCVQNMRQARDRLNEEIAELSYDDLVSWLCGHRYADLCFQRLAEKAAQQATTAALASAPTGR